MTSSKGVTGLSVPQYPWYLSTTNVNATSPQGVTGLSVPQYPWSPSTTNVNTTSPQGVTGLSVPQYPCYMSTTNVNATSPQGVTSLSVLQYSWSPSTINVHMTSSPDWSWPLGAQPPPRLRFSRPKETLASWCLSPPGIHERQRDVISGGASHSVRSIHPVSDQPPTPTAPALRRFSA